MKNYQAIYQINHDGTWMDYARLGVSHPDDAMADIRSMERANGKRFRARVEDWSDKSPDPDVYYGEWDKSQLSPAAQQNGVFKPVTY